MRERGKEVYTTGEGGGRKEGGREVHREGVRDGERERGREGGRERGGGREGEREGRKEEVRCIREYTSLYTGQLCACMSSAIVCKLF